MRWISRLTWVAWLLALSAHVACADPSRSELLAYRRAVPESAPTRTGSSPTLSSDGQILAYLADNRVWLLPGMDTYLPPEQYTRTPEGLPEAWAIEVDEAALSTAGVSIDQGYADLTHQRRAQWSPVGQRLAFIHQGRLFLAEAFDLQAKTARTRLLADLRVVEPEGEEPYGLEIYAPCWSPDGTMIAYLRRTSPDREYPEMHPFDLCVIEVSTGNERVLAHDGCGIDMNLPPQAWSPDGKSLVYPTVTGDLLEMRVSHISVVSLEQGRSAEVPVGGGIAFPAWSPQGDRIAWDRMGLSLTDPQGAHEEQVTGDTPARQAAKEKAERDEWQRLLAQQDLSWLTPEQRSAFQAGDLETWQFGDLFWLAGAEEEAKRVGGEFARRIGAVAAAYAATGDHGSMNGGILEAYDLLPRERKYAADERYYRAALAAAKDPVWVDRAPLWSRDGKRIAFVRVYKLPWTGQELLLLDLSTRESRSLFRGDRIDNVSWSADGRFLTLQSNQLVYFNHLGGQGDRFVYSYPEVWVLEPR